MEHRIRNRGSDARDADLAYTMRSDRGMWIRDVDKQDFNFGNVRIYGQMIFRE